MRLTAGLLILATALAVRAPVSAQTEPPPAVAAAPDVISPQGVRGVRIGMTGAEALAVLNRGIEAEAFSRWVEYGGNPGNSGACHGLGVQSDGEGEYGPLTFIVEGGRVTSYTVHAGYESDGQPPYVTDRGVHAWSTEAEVRQAYSEAVESTGFYALRPMTVLTQSSGNGAEARGLSFLLEEGRVWEIHAGGPSIGYLEGCP